MNYMPMPHGDHQSEQPARGHAAYMPLDIVPHWEWRNPLNIIPALILLLMIIAFCTSIL